MVNAPRRIIGIVNIINFNDDGIFQNLHSAAYIYTPHHWTGVWHGRVAPAAAPGSGAGTGGRRRHGGVAPARESGAGTGEWESGAGTGEWESGAVYFTLDM